MKSVALSLSVLALVVLGTLGAFPGSQFISQTDQQFLNGAIETGHTEIALARLVLRRSADSTARAYARRMIADHSANDNQLEALARRERTALPTGVMPAGQTELKRLSMLPASQVASSYLRGAVHDHKRAIADFRRELATTPSPLIRRYVRESLPALQQHLELAERAGR